MKAARASMFAALGGAMVGFAYVLPPVNVLVRLIGAACMVTGILIIVYAERL